MTDAILADFVGQFTITRPRESAERSDPLTFRDARFLLRDSRLKAVIDTDTTHTISLDDIYDVAVNTVPGDAAEFFRPTASIGYGEGDRRTLVVQADQPRLDGFVTTLFQALLNDEQALVTHPAAIDGAPTDESREPYQVTLTDSAIHLRDQPNPVRITLQSITELDRSLRARDGAPLPTLSAVHTNRDSRITTEISLDSRRSLQLLYRFTRSHRERLRDELSQEASITDDERKVLTCLRTHDNPTLSDRLDMDPAQVTMILNQLEERGLIATTDAATTLTDRGRLAAE